MNSFIENINQLGEQFLSIAWPMFWQSSLLITVVFALDFLLARKIRASIRYALWLAVLVKLLLPPTLALPTGAAWWLFQPKAAPVPVVKHFTVTYDNAPLPMDFVPQSISLPPPALPRLELAGWGLLAAGAVSVVLLIWLAVRWWQVARTVRGATASDGFSQPLAEAMRLPGAPMARLKIVEGAMSPAVCGLFRPVILLPRTLTENLSASQLRAVLLHELFHLRRRDVWVNCAQALLQIVYWWHPLLWIANTRIRRLREEAVDDAVMLALRDEADSYAPTLLEVAKLAFRRPLLSLGLVGIMESRSALRQRIERLVDFRAPRKAGLTFASLCGVCVFSAVALPMGEAPNSTVKSNISNATDTPVPEDQSLRLRVNPEIFFRNLKSQAANALQSPTNNWTDILSELLRDEGVDLNPPHGLAFTNATGDITTQNTPEQLEVFRRVIEQLNRADGNCELPLGNNPLRKNVLIEGRFYPMSDGEFDKFTADLHHYSGRLYGDEWWSVPPEMFKPFVNGIEASGLRLIQRPRIQTGSGVAADFYVGDRTNNLDLFCKPLVGHGFIDLTLQSTVVSGAPMNAVTNNVSSKASAEDHGGIVLRMANFGGHSGSNLVAVISAEIVTNATGFHQRLQTVIKRHAATNAPTVGQISGVLTDPNFRKVIYTLEQQSGGETLAEPEVTTTSGRGINRITMPNITVSLSDAYSSNSNPITASGSTEAIVKARGLVQDGKLLYEMGKLDDAEKNLKAALALDPESKAADYYLGLVRAARNGQEQEIIKPERQTIGESLERIRFEKFGPFNGLSLGEVAGKLCKAVRITVTVEDSSIVNLPIEMPLALENVSLQEALDAVILHAGKPIKYFILNGQVSFTLKNEPPVLFARTFKVDINTFVPALRGVPGLQTNSVTTMVKSLFSKSGVNWETPKGKSVFYNEKTGSLFVKATASDLDTIERVVSELNQVAPQIHIKARFVEVPKGTLLPLNQLQGATNLATAGITGILNAKNFQIVYRALESRNGFESLAEPEVTTTIGRQTQMRATQTTVTIITNFVFVEFPTNHNGSVGSIMAKTGPIETGPIFDVVPNVLSDGYTLDLQMTASSMEFYGYAGIPTNMPPLTVTTSTGETVGLPRAWPAVLRYQKSAHVNLFDNQTVILSLTNPEQVRFGDPDEKRELVVAKHIRDSLLKHGEKDILVFVTATIVDPAGNRVHSDADLPFAQSSVPSQPKMAMPGSR